MKAIVQTGQGSPDAVEVREVDLPEIAPDQALVRVHASSVNPAEWYRVMSPIAVRVVGKILSRGQPKPTGIGADLAGRIEAVGAEVTEFQPGDEVFGTSGASWAEYAPAREMRLVRKPANVSFEEAAAVPVAGLTALQALRDHGRVQPGQRVLINGASGGVGTFAVQLAKWLEADVTAVCSTSKVDLVRTLGADRVVDYTREDFTRGEPHDVVFDLVGNRSLRDCRRALTATGTLVLSSGPPSPTIRRMIQALALSPFTRQRLVPLAATKNAADLEHLTTLTEAGDVTPVVDRTYPLEQAAAALRHQHAGHARGRTVITVLSAG